MVMTVLTVSVMKGMSEVRKFYPDSPIYVFQDGSPRSSFGTLLPHLGYSFFLAYVRQQPLEFTFRRQHQKLLETFYSLQSLAGAAFYCRRFLCSFIEDGGKYDFGPLCHAQKSPALRSRSKGI